MKDINSVRGLDPPRVRLWVRPAVLVGETMVGAMTEWTERDLQKHVVELATVYGWEIYHTYDSHRSAPGFPDLVMVKERRLIFAELKREEGLLTDEQIVWANALMRTSAEYYNWRPSNLDEIAEVLGR